MIVQYARGNQRRGGYTTQMFIYILASNKNAIIRCRQTMNTMTQFMDTFNKLILHIKKNEVILVDGRSIKFIHMSNEKATIGFDGIVATDI